jgi:hypothetical protein
VSKGCASISGWKPIVVAALPFGRFLFLLGAAPDLDAFENPMDRDAARDFMEMMDKDSDALNL